MNTSNAKTFETDHGANTSGADEMDVGPSTSAAAKANVFGPPNIPLIETQNEAEKFPAYAKALQCPDGGFPSISELYNLQTQLEKMLKNTVARHNVLESPADEKHNENKPNETIGKLKRTGAPMSKNIKKLKAELLGLNEPFPQNDTSNEFWLSVEPYCSPITEEHLCFIDNLLEKQLTNINYAHNLLEVPLQNPSDLAVRPPESSNNSSDDENDFNESPDNNKDAILEEIKSVSAELSSVRNNNIAKLKTLREYAAEEVRRWEIKRKLETIDQEICEAYNRAQKSKLQGEPLKPEEEEEVYRLIAEQKILSDKL